MQKKIIKEELTSSQGPLAHKKITKMNPVSGGCIHNAWQIELSNGIELFAKTTSNEKFSMLQFEADCLKQLRQYANPKLLKIPEPLAVQKLSQTSILLMPWLDLCNGDQSTLGEGLAFLHKDSTSQSNKDFGWSRKGYIGSSIQERGLGENWGTFFVNFRLIPQIKKGESWGLKLSDFKELLRNLSIFLNEHEPKPSLVHGDLWSGNIAIEKSGKGIIFDPASWWADREVDIAMTRMFGGFSKDFYNGYNKIWKLSDCSETRIEIYNLYHLINHANIFGGHYQQQSLSQLNKIALRFKS